MKTLTAAFVTAVAAACLFGGSAMAADTRVAYGDLNLSNPADMAELDARIATAARAFCRQDQTTGTRLSNECRQAYREEVLTRLTHHTANPEVVRYAVARLPARKAP